MSVSFCSLAVATGDCRACDHHIETVVEKPGGREGVYVRGLCGHTNWMTEFEPLSGGVDV